MTTKPVIAFFILISSLLMIRGESVANSYAEISGDEKTGEEKPVLNLSENIQELLKSEKYSEMKILVENWRKNLDSSVQVDLVRHLFERVIKTDRLDLKQDGSVFVLSRIRSGQEKYNHHGEIILQDIYIEGGRCAWAIQLLLDCELPQLDTENKDGYEKYIRSAITSVVECMTVPGEIEDQEKYLDAIIADIKSKEISIPLSVSLIKKMAMPETTKPFQLPVKRRIELAASEETKPILLERLINDPSIEVRRVLVANPRLPMRALRKMEEDKNPEIREAALSESLKSRTLLINEDKADQ